ncbi:MAG: cupin domain-containing protein [Candidatus Solibacter sp.]
METSSTAALMTANGEGRPVHVLGSELMIRVSSRDTHGAFAVFESCIAPLEGPPLHRHPNQDESFYILEGEFRFEVDGQEFHASAGASVVAPRGSSHTFQNVGQERGRMITTVVPGGLDLFFEDVEAVSPRGVAPDLARLLPVLKKHGQEMLGPPLRVRDAGVASGAD